VVVGRWKRSARAEDTDLAAEQRTLDERLEQAKRATAERKAKQAADEAEVLRTATEEGRQTAAELARRAAAEALARQAAQRKAWLAAAGLTRQGVEAEASGHAAEAEAARSAEAEAARLAAAEAARLRAETEAARAAEAEAEAARAAEELANRAKASEEPVGTKPTGTLPILDWFAARDQALSRAEPNREGVGRKGEPPA
jgi:hypothetical protein